MASKRKRSRKRGPGIVATLRDRRKIQTLYLFMLIALVFGGSLGFSNQCSRRMMNRNPVSEGGLKPSDPIARIEGHEITYAEYTSALDVRHSQIQAEDQNQVGNVLHPPEYWADVNYRVLRQLMDIAFLNIRATQAGITVTPAEINEKVEEMRKSLMATTTPAEERSLLQRILDSISAAREEQAFQLRLQQAYLDPTMTLAKFRRQTAQILTAQKYLSKLESEELQRINDRLSQRMLEIRGEIEGGKDFAEAAREYSEDASKDAGGLVPLVKHNTADLPKTVVDTAFSLPPGEISQPIIAAAPEDKRGVWLVTVVSRKEASGPDWEQARETIRAQLLEEKKKKVEEGTMEMPEEGNLTVSDDEVIQAYEEASIRVIFLKSGDPMQAVAQAVDADMRSARIEIYRPQLRSTHHIALERYSLAAADLLEALDELKKQLQPDQSNQLEIEMAEGQLRYLMANLWSTRAFIMERKFWEDVYKRFQEDPEAFANETPEVPQEIKEEQQAYFVMALRNLDRSIQIEGMDPWSRLQRARIDLAREQVTGRVIEDLSIAHEYSSRDYNLENQILSALRQAIAADDKALREAGSRPESVVSTVLPEDEMGLTLESLEAPYRALIGQWQTQLPESRQPSGTAESTASDDIDLGDLGLASTSGQDEPSVTSAAEEEISNSEPPGEESGSSTEFPEVTPPLIPIAAPSGPLTQELRDRLDKLVEDVQRVVDELDAARQAAEEERRRQMEQQTQQLDVNREEETPVPTDE